MAARRRRSARGFTVIELLVVVSVLAVLGALAAPGMQKLIATQRLKSASYDMVSDLTLARSEALKRSATVQVAPQSSAWTNGWTVTSGGTTLGQRNSLGNGISVSSSANPASFYFDANGRAVDSGGSLLSSNAKIGFQNGYGQYRCISLDPQGRPKSSSSACT